MNRFKGAPAPWRHDKYHRTVKASTYETVCIVPTTSNKCNANANLIAAAPELLGELIRLRNIIASYKQDSGDNLDITDAVIAKALGEAK